MNHPTMTDRISTTLTGEEMKKQAGTVKGIDETDPNDMAFKLVTMFVCLLCHEYSYLLLFFAFFMKCKSPPPPSLHSLFN